MLLPPAPSWRHHRESHRGHRAGWLRAAVLGANDGIVSVAGVVVGVAASGSDLHGVLAAGIAAAVAGAMSMAAGEYVSVQSQADTERADLAIERRELHENPQAELDELTQIYHQRGLDPALARQVAEQLSAHDSLAAHARDELGISEIQRTHPLQAAVASAAAFCVGAMLPLATAALAPTALDSRATAVITLAGLSITGAWAATMGGASPWRGALRVTFWGAAAMIAAGQIGRLFHVSV